MVDSRDIQSVAVANYRLGFRALKQGKHYFFINPNGRKLWATDRESLKEWEAMRKIHADSWKERHAKGVPVKMTDKQLRESKPAEEDIQHVYGKEGDYPGVQCWDLNEPDYWPHLFATFCNFRYKPEWLEKKKREPYLCKEERCFGKWDCDKVGCWRNRKPDLGYSDFDSPPIGGFKD